MTAWKGPEGIEDTNTLINVLSDILLTGEHVQEFVGLLGTGRANLSASVIATLVSEGEDLEQAKSAAAALTIQLRRVNDAAELLAKAAHTSMGSTRQLVERVRELRNERKSNSGLVVN